MTYAIIIWTYTATKDGYIENEDVYTATKDLYIDNEDV